MQITKEDVRALPVSLQFLEGFELESGSKVREDFVRENKTLNRLQFLVLLVGAYNEFAWNETLSKEFFKTLDIPLNKKFDLGNLAKRYFCVWYGYCAVPQALRDRGHGPFRNPRAKLFERVGRGKYKLSRGGQAMYDTIVKGFFDA